MTEKEKLYFQNSTGQKLAGELFSSASCTPEDGGFPAVIFAHGLLSTRRGRKSEALVERLCARGFVFFTFDSYGRGESEGEFSNFNLTRRIDGLRCAIALVSSRKNVNPQKLCVVGSSFGGLAAIMAAAEDEKLGGLVLIAPAVNFSYSDIPESLKLELDFNEEFYKDAASYDPYKEAEKIKCPVLIIHGEEDESVPADYSRNLSEHIEDCTLEVIQDAGHTFEEQAGFGAVISLTVGFLRQL